MMTCLGVFTAVSATFPVVDPTFLSTLDPQSLDSLAHSFAYWKTSSQNVLNSINNNVPIPIDSPMLSEVSLSMKAYLNKMGYSFEVPVNINTITEFDRAAELSKKKILSELVHRMRG